MSRPSIAEIEAKIAALVPGYLARRAQDVERLREAHAAGDLARIAAIGHDLRGTGTGYGQPWISEIGAALEAAARRGDGAAAARSIDALEAGLAERVSPDARFQAMKDR